MLQNEPTDDAVSVRQCILQIHAIKCEFHPSAIFVYHHIIRELCSIVSVNPSVFSRMQTVKATTPPVDLAALSK